MRRVFSRNKGLTPGLSASDLELRVLTDENPSAAANYPRHLPLRMSQSLLIKAHTDDPATRLKS